MTAAKSRYKLFASPNDGDSSKVPCAFFASPAGCRNGDSCKFSHGGETSPPPEDTAMDTSSVVSSESEETPQPSPPPKKKDKQQKQQQEKSNERKKKRKERSSNSGSSIFAAPKSKKASNTVQQSKKSSVESSTPPSKPITFRDMQLPVASFSIPSNNNISHESHQGSNHTSSQQTTTPPTKKKKKKKTEALPLPTHTDVGKSWSPVVEATRSHSRFSSLFDFDKEISSEVDLGKCSSSQDWFQPRQYGSWCQQNPQAIAIDCEMCETKCPKTGVLNSRALCRLSIVDAENPSDVLLDTLVKPDWPVSNYRTWVNGITEDHLKDVKFTMDHAQNFMMALCSQETVVVGHAVHNDLFALRMIHSVVADSALLFQVKDAENPQRATCSLFDLTYHIQKTEMPKLHDSVNDARMALHNIVEGWKKKGGKDIEPIPRSNRNPKHSNNSSSTVNPIAATQLFCHRIPKVCQPDHLQSMFEEHTHVVPTSINDIEFSKTHGKTVVTFASSRHANLAFDMLDGEAEAEKSGRDQKRVFLRNGDYMNVRKMVHSKPRGEHSNHSNNQKLQSSK